MNGISVVKLKPNSTVPKIITVTPEMAMELLDHNELNRPLSDKHVQRTSRRSDGHEQHISSPHQSPLYGDAETITVLTGWHVSTFRRCPLDAALSTYRLPFVSPGVGVEHLHLTTRRRANWGRSAFWKWCEAWGHWGARCRST